MTTEAFQQQLKFMVLKCQPSKRIRVACIDAAERMEVSAFVENWPEEYRSLVDVLVDPTATVCVHPFITEE